VHKKNLNQNRIIPTATTAATISVPTCQKPFGPVPNGISATFMPHMLVSTMTGRILAEKTD
jgi:hypothetical protein